MDCGAIRVSRAVPNRQREGVAAGRLRNQEHILGPRRSSWAVDLQEETPSGVPHDDNDIDTALINGQMDILSRAER